MSITKNDKIAKMCYNCGIKIPSKKFYLTCKITKNSSKYNIYCINCKLCPKFHNMNFVKNLRSQSSQKKTSLYFNNKFICDNCGIKRDNAKGKVLHCIRCKFDYCEVCYDKNEEVFVKDLEVLLGWR